MEHKSIKGRKSTPTGYRQKMTQVHTWFGLLLGWILFIIFLAGSLSYFRVEITRWMQPEVSDTQTVPSITDVYAALDLLERDTRTRQADAWVIQPSSARDKDIFIYTEQQGEWKSYRYQPDTQTLIQPRATEGGDLLYTIHYDLYHIPYPYSRIIVGIASMMMLIALISGIIVHKKIFAEFFTFRWGRGQRSWLDAHNAFSVLSLPFQLMIVPSGLIIFASSYMPWAVRSAQIEGDALYERYYSYRAPVAEASHQQTPNTAKLLHKIASDWQGKQMDRVRVNNPNTDKAMLIIDVKKNQQVSELSHFRAYDVNTGLIHATQQAHVPFAFRFNELITGLHAGRFADVGLRWLYFICGLCGAAMIGSGLVLWMVKRRRQLKQANQSHIGFYVVERLNMVTIAGFPLAIVGYFWLNRLLPTQLEDRQQIEIQGMFLVWLVFCIAACALPTVRAWKFLLLALMVLLIGLPVLNHFTTDRGFLMSLVAEDWLFVTFDVMCWFVALLVGIVYRFYHQNVMRAFDLYQKPKTIKKCQKW